MSSAESQLDFRPLGGSGEAHPKGASASDGASSNGAASRGANSSAGIWLNGDVLACACPDCGSPMSIRLWLMVADCWRCGASVELTEEQEREARRLLEERDAKPPAAAPAKAENTPPPKPKPAETKPPEKKQAPNKPQQKPAQQQPAASKPKKEKPKPAAAPAAKKPVPTPRPSAKSPPPVPKVSVAAAASAGTRVSAALKPSRVRSRLDEMENEGEVALWFRDKLRDLPAWLASAIIHMALLILLATVMFAEEESPERPFVLSTRIRDAAKPGEFEDPAEADPIEFDDAGAPEPEEKIKPEPPGKAEESKEEPKDPGEEPGKDPEPPPFVGGAPGGRGAAVLHGRTPEARARLVRKEGGTIHTEAAVAGGLEWIKAHQNRDGSWSLNGFHRAPACRGRCKNPGGVSSDTAATALALLPFLGAGQTHKSGNYQETVRKGLYWLIDHQGPGGNLMGRGNGRMYAHGLAAIALCEAYALTKDGALRAPAQSAVDFIAKAQHKPGGWRYAPGQAGDVSVVGWQLMALRSGQMADLYVPSGVFEKANKFLDTAKTDKVGGLYTYVPRARDARNAMTAEALLCRQYSGWPRSHPGMRAGCDWLLKHHPPSLKKPNMYYWYYATQTMHHMGGEHWRRWNTRMRDVLVNSQESRGHQAGSWAPRGGHSGSGGRLYMTALAVCTLEVYYRHLPLYRDVAVE